MIWNKQWKTTHPVPLQPMVLVTGKTPKPRTTGEPEGDNAITNLKAKNSAWKFDCSKLSAKTYTKNNKTYHWCIGLGHSIVGMWVIPEPGTCTCSAKGKGSGTPQASATKVRTSNSGTQGNCSKKANFKAHIVQVLASANTFGDDTTDLVNKIIAEYK